MNIVVFSSHIIHNLLFSRESNIWVSIPPGFLQTVEIDALTHHIWMKGSFPHLHLWSLAFMTKLRMFPKEDCSPCIVQQAPFMSHFHVIKSMLAL